MMMDELVMVDNWCGSRNIFVLSIQPHDDSQKLPGRLLAGRLGEDSKWWIQTHASPMPF